MNFQYYLRRNIDSQLNNQIYCQLQKANIQVCSFPTIEAVNLAKSKPTEVIASIYNTLPKFQAIYQPNNLNMVKSYVGKPLIK